MTTAIAAPSHAVHRAVLPKVMLALATVVSAVASLNVAIPSIARETHATQTQLSWIIDAYALVFAALLLLGGAIGDRYGRRRALVAGLAVFGAGSIAAMAVSGPGWLIATRGVLGLGAALVMPETLSTITSTFPQEQRIGQGGPIDAWAPVMFFAILFGLSMDFQVFLVSRMNEEWLHSKDNARSITVGQAETGGIITAAALIMIAVFGGFMLGDLRAIKTVRNRPGQRHLLGCLPAAHRSRAGADASARPGQLVPPDLA
jgi:MFS family permease